MNFVYITYTLISLIYVISCEEVCYKDKCHENNTKFRYLFYDVNPPEGFNLRRDVYMRMATLMNKMKKSKDPALNSFKLVLPPWSHLMHWGYSENPEYIPWSHFFDIKSLQAFAPVIELHTFFDDMHKNKYSKIILDKVYVLQHFEDMFQTGNFEDRWQVEKCQKPPKLRYFFYSNITSNNVKCLSFHGSATKLTEILSKTSDKTILIEHAEVALHDMFGSKTYWQARRSMRFNNDLRKIADEFRKIYLNSSNDVDNTYYEADWQKDKLKRNTIGGPYLAVHIRRRDFLRGRADELPNLKSVAEQITKKLDYLKLKTVFIATDAPHKEYIELESYLNPKYMVYRYIAPPEVVVEYHEGGVAIIDQIICSYARFFIGTSESTFTFRIQEEREILGFPIETTFNVLCKDEENCKKPSIWQIVY